MTLTFFFVVLMYEVIKIKSIPILRPFLKPRTSFSSEFSCGLIFIVLKSNLSYPYSEIGPANFNNYLMFDKVTRTVAFF